MTERERAARALLGHALSLDPANRPAQFAVAQLDLRAGYDDHDLDKADAVAVRRARALDTLDSLRETAADWAPGGWWKRQERKVTRRVQNRRPEWDDPYWFRATYALAAETEHARLAKLDGQNEGPCRKALALALELARATEQTLAWRVRHNRPLRAYLSGLEASVLVFLAAVQAARPKSTGPAVEADSFALSCPAPSRRALSRRALSRQIRLADEGKLTLVPEEIICFVTKNLSPVGYRAAYNLACFYAQSGDDQAALGQFTDAMLSADVELLAWARKDPTLKSLHSHAFFDIIRDALDARAAMEHIRDGARTALTVHNSPPSGNKAPPS